MPKVKIAETAEIAKTSDIAETVKFAQTTKFFGNADNVEIAEISVSAETFERTDISESL